jgi:hypothetical protein
VIGRDERGVRHPARARERQQLGAQRDEVVGRAVGLQAGVQAVHQPARLRRHARGAAAGVTALGLDAADREHRLAPHADEVAAEREREQRGVREAEAPGAAEDDLLGKTRAGERGVDAGGAELEGQRDVIGEAQRRRARAPLTAVDRDEVRPAARHGHALHERLPEAGLAHGGLDAHGQAGRAGDHLDELDQAVHVAERGVGGRAHAVLPNAHAAHGRDVRAHLDGGQEPAEAGLGPLGELDLDSPQGCLAEPLAQLLQAEAPGLVPAAEVAGADLEDELPPRGDGRQPVLPRRCSAGSPRDARRG